MWAEPLYILLQEWDVMRKYINSVAAFHLPVTLHSSLLRSAEVLIKEDACHILFQNTFRTTPLHTAAEIVMSLL